MAQGRTCTVVFADGRRCVRRHYAKGMCKECRNWSWRHGGADPNGRTGRRPMNTVLADLKAAAEATTNACIDFRGQRQRPRARLNGVQMAAARAVWTLANGDPGDRWVLHTCHRGEEGCINIRHLYLGGARENVRDRDGAGRQARGDRSGHAVLTSDDVREMRRLAADGMSQRVISRRFGVTEAQVSHIIHRKQWAWLER